ncbi:MAG: DUF2924 domain-containing protein [Vulcanimicrobiota bacterium]
MEEIKAFDELSRLDNDAKKKFWLQYFNKLPHRFTRGTDRKLWYMIQCEQLSLSIHQKHITRLNRYSKDPDKHIINAYKTKYSFKEGMELVKTYKGREYRVIYRQGQFFYKDGSYDSISAVARAICGMKVSGYNFFGLERKV